MRAILVDTGVLVSIAVALVLTGIVLRMPSLSGRRAPAGLIALASFLAALAVADVSGERYDTERIRWYSTRLWVVVAVILVVVALTALAVWIRRRPQLSIEFSTVFAGVPLGLFLCIPETDLLRLVPGALAVPALAVAAGRLPPFGPITVALTSAGLGWVIVIDGVARGSAAVGALACLATPLLLPLAHRWPPSRWATVRTLHGASAFRILVLGAVILGCSRVAGLRGSAEIALIWAVVFFTAGAAGLYWMSDRAQKSSMVPSGS